jgi:hypothetical protein
VFSALSRTKEVLSSISTRTNTTGSWTTSLTSRAKKLIALLSSLSAARNYPNWLKTMLVVAQDGATTVTPDLAEEATLTEVVTLTAEADIPATEEAVAASAETEETEEAEEVEVAASVEVAATAVVVTTTRAALTTTAVAAGVKAMTTEVTGVPVAATPTAIAVPRVASRISSRATEVAAVECAVETWATHPTVSVAASSQLLHTSPAMVSPVEVSPAMVLLSMWPRRRPRANRTLFSSATWLKRLLISSWHQSSKMLT